MSAVALFFLVTCLSSVVGAISGIGGGIIIKPVLELVTSESVQVISFLSGCTVLAMAAVSLLRRRREIRTGFELFRGTMLALGSALGGVAGKLLFDMVRRAAGPSAVGVCQSAVLIAMALFLIAQLALRSRVAPRDLRGGAPCAALGAGLGLLSAFLGIGGGPLNLYALHHFLSMDARRASLHSIYIILFSQAASLALTFAQRAAPAVPPQLLLTCVLGGVSGAMVGSALVKKMADRAMNALYLAILIFVLALAAVNLAGYLG